MDQPPGRGRGRGRGRGVLGLLAARDAPPVGRTDEGTQDAVPQQNIRGQPERNVQGPPAPRAVSWSQIANMGQAGHCEVQGYRPAGAQAQPNEQMQRFNQPGAQTQQRATAQEAQYQPRENFQQQQHRPMGAQSLLAQSEGQTVGGRGRGRGRGWAQVAQENSVGRITEEIKGLRVSGGQSNGVSDDRNAQRGGHDLAKQTSVTRDATFGSKQGVAGKKCRLYSNCFHIKKTADWSVYQYHVEFSHEEDSKFVRRGLMGCHKEVFPSGLYFYEGDAELYLRHHVPNGFELTSRRERDGQIITIKIKYIREVPWTDYHRLDLDNKLLRRCMSRLVGLTLVDRTYFDKEAAASLTCNDYQLEVWPGYKTSIRQYEDDVFLNVEICHRFLRRDTAAAVFNRHMHSTHPHQQRAIENELLGKVVMTGYNDETYTISDISWDQNANSTFDARGTTKTFAEYYKQRWGITIKETNLPLLVTRPKKKAIHAGQTGNIFLIPELCNLTGLDDRMRSNHTLMKEKARLTNKVPAARVAELKKFMNRIIRVPEIVKEAAAWGLEFSSQMVEVPGRILNPETIQNAKNRPLSKLNGDWRGGLRELDLSASESLKRWVVIAHVSDQDYLKQFGGCVIRAARGIKMAIQDPNILLINSRMDHEYLQAIDRCVARYNPQLIMCIVPDNNNTHIYNAIKQKTTCVYGIPSQVVKSRTIRAPKGLMSVATGIVTQTNSKLCGEPAWKVGDLLGLFRTKTCMVMGFDVYHDTGRNRASVGALAASYDRELTQYNTFVKQHATTAQELSSFIGTQAVIAARKYQQCNGGKLPTYIIIYRDGVGDGQFHHVKEMEIKRIKELLDSLYGDIDYKFAFFIVNKRINMRFFLVDGNNWDLRNPEPGTVVDDVVTLHDRYDFYLVSHSTRNGTVSPTSYTIIENSTGFTSDMLQRFTYMLCHLYVNYSGTISVPAPLQHAHKCAYRHGENLHQETVFGKMASTPYYL